MRRRSFEKEQTYYTILVNVSIDSFWPFNLLLPEKKLDARRWAVSIGHINFTLVTRIKRLVPEARTASFGTVFVEFTNCMFLLFKKDSMQTNISTKCYNEILHSISIKVIMCWTKYRLCINCSTWFIALSSNRSSGKQFNLWNYWAATRHHPKTLNFCKIIHETMSNDQPNAGVREQERRTLTLNQSNALYCVLCIIIIIHHSYQMASYFGTFQFFQFTFPHTDISYQQSSTIDYRHIIQLYLSRVVHQFHWLAKPSGNSIDVRFILINGIVIHVCSV